MPSAAASSRNSTYPLVWLCLLASLAALCLAYECPGTFTNPCWVSSCPGGNATAYWSSCGSTLASAESLGCRQKTYTHFKTCGILESQYLCCA